MAKTRKELIDTIVTLQRLIPSDDFKTYLDQANDHLLDFVNEASFLPSMNEKVPNSLNDVELNFLSKSKEKYYKNVFIPTIAEEQANILKDEDKESEAFAIKRWSNKIKKAQSLKQLYTIITQLNRLKKSYGKEVPIKKPSFLKKLFGKK